MVPFTVVMALLGSCSQSPEPLHTDHELKMLDDTIINYNQQVVQSENQEIEDFARRYRWQMKISSTGLRSMIYKNGQGKQAGKEKMATIQYTVKKLNGDIIERTDPDHPLIFELGKQQVPNGLEEGVLLMRTGDHAKLIVPSHLAFGLLGDLDKIYHRTTLVYDVHLMDVKEK